MANVMIDIETLGSSPGAAIVTISAVRFNLITGETKEELYLNIDPKTCVNIGLHIDPSTIVWWLKQAGVEIDECDAPVDLDEILKLIPEDANEAVMEAFSPSKGVHIDDALNELSGFIKSSDKVWGNSARFDLGILDMAYRAIASTIPWKFYNERCLRTLVAFDNNVKRHMDFDGQKHHALDDCKHQIKYAVEIWNKYFKR